MLSRNLGLAAALGLLAGLAAGRPGAGRGCRRLLQGQDGSFHRRLFAGRRLRHLCPPAWRRISRKPPARPWWSRTSRAPAASPRSTRWCAATTDGLTFQMLNGEAAILSQLTGKPGVAYDMTKVSILARVEEEPHFMLVNPKMPNDLKAIIASGKKVKFSAGSRTDNLGDYAAVLCEALKMNCQIITGYKGSKGASLAMFNGEADALTISESSGAALRLGRQGQDHHHHRPRALQVQARHPDRLRGLQAVAGPEVVVRLPPRHQGVRPRHRRPARHPGRPPRLSAQGVEGHPHRPGGDRRTGQAPARPQLRLA